jgi:hypothetical protein
MKTAKLSNSITIISFVLALSLAALPAAKAQYGNYTEQLPGGYRPAAGNGQPGTYGSSNPGVFDTSYGGGQSPYPPSPLMHAPQQGAPVAQWFAKYDQIRRQAQMSPQERQQADYFLSKITAIFVPGQEKLEAKNLLTRMVSRYRQASIAIKQLPVLKETAQLQKGFYQYFVTAGNLFIDYLKVQENLLATDAQTGQPIAAQLMQRKQGLEELNMSIQSLDEQSRARFGIAPYQYQ